MTENAIHVDDFYLSGKRFLIAWKLYPIDRNGQITDEDGTKLWGNGEFSITTWKKPSGHGKR